MSDGMHQDQLPERDADRRDLIGLEADQIEAIRLAEVLSAEEAGTVTNIDPVADAEIAELARTVNVVRDSLGAASAHRRFSSFHEASRARVMSATPRPRAVLAEERPSLLQRWNGLFTSMGAAAAASAATFIVALLAFGGAQGPVATVQVIEPQPQPATVATTSNPERINLTSLSMSEQLTVYVGLLERLNALTSEGEPASQDLLRDLAETGATVRRTMVEQPDTVSPADAWVAYQTGFKGQQVLNQAVVTSEEDQQVLSTAQATADSAFVTAARFLENPERAPSADDAAQALAALQAPASEE